MAYQNAFDRIEHNFTKIIIQKKKKKKKKKKIIIIKLQLL